MFLDIILLLEEEGMGVCVFSTDVKILDSLGTINGFICKYTLF
jgi:hypothetical protein